MHGMPQAAHPPNPKPAAEINTYIFPARDSPLKGECIVWWLNAQA